MIHEAIGEVLFDPTGTFEPGSHVVLIPNAPTEVSEKYKENYNTTSKFSSSSIDGFMQDVLSIAPSRLVSIDHIDPLAAVMSELMSVVFNAIDDLPKRVFEGNQTIGIWGNGNIGYLATIILRALYPQLTVYVFGRNARKQQYFTSAHKQFNITDDLSGVFVDHAIECVGGDGSESAINQIIDVIRPQGVISLLGVSERAPQVNTRMILEKGLTLVGSSRSGKTHFESAVQFLQSSKENQLQVKRLVTSMIDVTNVAEISAAFEQSMVTDFKTVMKWNM